MAGGVARQWFRHAGDYERPDGWNTLDLYAFGDQAEHGSGSRRAGRYLKIVPVDPIAGKVQVAGALTPGSGHGIYGYAASGSVAGVWFLS